MKTGRLDGLLKQPIRFPRWVKGIWFCLSAILFVRAGLVMFGFNSLFNTWGDFISGFQHFPSAGWAALGDIVLMLLVGVPFFALLVLVTAVFLAVALCLAWPFVAVLAVLVAIFQRTSSPRMAEDGPQPIRTENKARKGRVFILAGILVALLAYLFFDVAYGRYSARRQAVLMDSYYKLRPGEMTQQDVLTLLGRPDWKRGSVLGYCQYRPADSNLFMLGEALFGTLATTAVTFALDSKGMLVGRFYILSSGWMGYNDIYNQLVENERTRDWGDGLQNSDWATYFIERRHPGVKVLNVSCPPSTGNVAFADRRVYDASVTYEQSGSVRQASVQFANDMGNIEEPSAWKDEELPQGQKQ